MTQEFIADDEILRVARHCLILRSNEAVRERRRMKDEDEDLCARKSTPDENLFTEHFLLLFSSICHAVIPAE